MSKVPFGELRALLSQPPGLINWISLCNLLDRAASYSLREVREVWLPYLEDHLRTWPDHLRNCPSNWLGSLILGEGVPMLSITRSVTISQSAHMNVLLANFQSSPYTSKIRRMEIRAISLMGAKVKSLFGGVTLPQITSLGLMHVWSDAQGMLHCFECLPNITTLHMDMISTSGVLGDESLGVMPHQLEILNLGFGSITEDVLWSCVEHACWFTLHTLNVHGAAMSPDALAPIFRARSLQTLDVGRTRMLPNASLIEQLQQQCTNLTTLYAEQLDPSISVPSLTIHRRPLLVF